MGLIEKEKLEKNIMEFMEILGLDLSNPSLKDTPKRIAKMYSEELFSGLYDEPPKITLFPNDGKYNNMVILKNIDEVSVCEHHFMPFTIKVSVAYIPSKKGNIVGISKLARIIRWFARRPQVQERLTKQIADFIVEKLKPAGVAVLIEGQHYCMIARGVEKANSIMVTSEVRGAFKESETRNEFLRLIK